MNGDPASSGQEARTFIQLMKRYVVDYTNSHDQSETASIMEPDYELRMGSHVLRGRDSAYAEATRRQLTQFPGLTLTVHEIHSSADRLVLRFSEHGASLRHGGARAVWSGIGLYRWNGARLISNLVEQDYLSRAAQLESRRALTVEAPAIAPWDETVVEVRPECEAIVRAWLARGEVAMTPGVQCDDGGAATEGSLILKQQEIVINDLFSCGSAVAFHGTQHGSLLADFAPAEKHVGCQVSLHMAGLVHVEGHTVVAGRVIRNRLDLLRSLS